LLREARRQKGLPSAAVPEVCILDPDGDIVRYREMRNAPSATQLGPATTQTFMPFVMTDANMELSIALSMPHLLS
jgi:hypothetical protein